MKDGYITLWEELHGKKIVRVIQNDNDIYLTLADGTRAVIQVMRERYGEGYGIYLGDPLEDPYELNKAGWLTDELYEKYEMERQQQYEKEKEERERREYEKLKKKYEGSK